MKKYLIIAALALTHLSMAQKMERLDATKKIVCYASPQNMGTRIYSRNAFAQSLTAAGAADNSTNIEVTYNGFSPEAQAAFQRAIDIWASLITSPVTIHIDATWEDLESGTLGSALWHTAFRNFEGAKEVNTWYPVAIAEKMAGIDLNDPADSDIDASFNSGANWYLGLDGNPSTGQYDLISVVMHEIGHGLGFVDSFGYSSGIGSVGIQGIPFVFDLSVENSEGTLLTELENNSEELGDELTSNAVYFDSPSAREHSNSRPRLYAPTTWSSGSSIAHLNENTYPSGNPNSLMTPQIGANEVMQDPGQITLDMFADMGWEYTYIEHTNLPNTENISADGYTVTAIINSDVGYVEDEVMLYYSTDLFENDTTVVQMATTGNTNEFSAEIASTKIPGQVYAYFISTKDIKDRVFTKPSLVPNYFFAFQTGQDTDPPVIVHSPPNFVRASEPTLTLEAVVWDFLPVEAVQLEYYVNDQAAQTVEMALTNEVDSVYSYAIDLTSLFLLEGDSIRYKIMATDQASTANTATYPTNGLIKLNVVATADPVNFYTNNFNDVATSGDDFYASEYFSVKEENDFSSGAIHSVHPYPDGTGANDESEYVYELRVPIILNANAATLRFDEVVLVEPGEAGTVLGDAEFWDYVIVEGSKDGGKTWLPLVDGYDSRANSQWLTTYNSTITNSNSQGTGKESLYVQREINLLNSGNFTGGDEVLFRFRLHADQAAHGWGWAIDNLNIQTDNSPPVILHDHLDYVTTTSPIELNTIVLDDYGVDSVGVELVINDQEPISIEMTNTEGNTYQVLLDITALNTGDVINYRFVAFDTNLPTANKGYLPSEESFFKVPVISFGEAQASYSNDFDTESDDFVGNFFSIVRPTGFSNGAIHSEHPYPMGFGLDSTSTFTYTLKTPIKISQSTPYISYDEEVLVEPATDYVALEASKDNGLSWFQVKKYSSSKEPLLWQQKFQAGVTGSDALLKQHLIKLTDNSQIQVGDEVLFRFRLERKSTKSGWGWAIDNLQIQSDVITALEPASFSDQVKVYPNPVKNGLLKLKLENPSTRKVDYAIQQMNGQTWGTGNQLALDNENILSIDVSALPSGLYLLKVVEGDRASIHKVMKLD